MKPVRYFGLLVLVLGVVGIWPTLAAAQDVPIVYVRCPRSDVAIDVTGEVTVDGTTSTVTRSVRGWDVYDVMPDVSAFHGGFTAPCDLMYREPDGSQRVLYDCTGTSRQDDACAAMDPAVSLDGQTIAFAVFRGSLEPRTTTMNARVLDPDADSVRIDNVEIPQPRLSTATASIHLVDPVTGELTEVLAPDGAIDSGPAFLPNGRLMFTSTRDGNRSTIVYRTGSNGRLGTRLYTVDLDGRNLDLASPDALGVEEHPFVLRDGRVAFSSWQVGMSLPFRHTNGSPGGFTTLDNLFHIYTRNPDGSHVFAFYGQHCGDHTRVTALDHDHKAAHFLTQTSDGRVWFADYYRANNNGLGKIVGVMPEPEGQEGFGPHEVENRGDLFAPRDLVTFASWSSSSDSMATPTPIDAPVVNDNYADPIPFYGKVGHPSALPDNGMMVVWGHGACGTVASDNVFEALGVEPPPHTSGSGQGTAVNVINSLGTDTPGCDAGIYLAGSIPSQGPEDLVRIVDTREYNELFPRAVVSYEAIHGVERPEEIPRADLATSHGALEVGTPFGLLGAASITDRETHPLDGISFVGEHQFQNQGTDTINYDDEDLCGVRILGAMPNRGDRAYQQIANAAGERLAIVGEFPVRNYDATGAPRTDPSGNADTSFLVRFPADMPYFMQAIDCDGRTLNTDQSWQSLRPGEMKTCGGCHVHSRPSRVDFDDTFAATDDYRITRLGEGMVPLLAGDLGEGEVEVREVAGYGLQVDLHRDIMPIFEARCNECHGSDDPAAGLRLDRPGIEEGTTWYCLARDGGQSCVPEALKWADESGDTRMRRPQLTKYVRAFNSLGSLLYWKAKNERTDRFSDGDRAFDVDFGEDHPTDITQEELGLLSRWIDLGCPGGAEETRDTQRPTLHLAASVSDGAVDELRVGTTDLGEGVDVDSLSVCVLDDDGTCEADLAAEADPHGIVAIPLATSLADPDVVVRATVTDLAGNTNTVERTVGWLLGSPPPPPPLPERPDAGTPDAGGPDSGSPDAGGRPASDVGAGVRDNGGTASGRCGCRTVVAADPPTTVLVVMVMVLMIVLRRRF